MSATAAARTDAAEGEDDQQDGHEHGRTDRSLRASVLPRGRLGQRPKRRWRLANSRSAASKASGPKSGQSASHE